ncbi:hypothetical protein N7457_005798 [Penicillium paradoxum]|uniref:uncharacterized protein n=1 Tax=Penicillium paradoxum TaxID=176176 RepID=UPI0025481B27|nr:uncharacterized protein N7457_005798 [Penicillium paradoxum]KAJ5780638.1 hypothetical protein N7457_005798 [Penicillium paradoxum]
MSQNDLTDEFCESASNLLGDVRLPKNARLKIYAPRMTTPMRSFQHLDIFGVGVRTPSLDNLMTRSLELFSGSLCFTSFEEYKNFRYFLGLFTDNMVASQAME